MSPIIRTEALRKFYRDTLVLNGLTMTIEEGSVMALLGPNGAGKTTTLKILMNILEATNGRAEVLGVDSRCLGPKELAQIGYVSENQDLPGWMTLDYLLHYLQPFYPSWDVSRVSELLRQFSLPRDRRVSELSHGMRMKTALLSSLAYRPKLLVMDEPFTGLDPVVREDLIEGMIESASETTILISSHDLGEIESFATHIAYLENGRLHFAEELTSLTTRFREINVLVSSPSILRSGKKWPDTWMAPQSSPAMVRFVETKFDPERTTEQIHEIFDGVDRISTSPMPLRAIFLSLARGNYSS